jgi:hypothetical protein
MPIGKGIKSERFVFHWLKKNGVRCLWVRGWPLRGAPDFITPDGTTLDAKCVLENYFFHSWAFGRTTSQGTQDKTDFFLCIPKGYYINRRKVVLVIPRRAFSKTTFTVRRRDLDAGKLNKYLYNVETIKKAMRSTRRTKGQKHGLKLWQLMYSRRKDCR